jgi:hypothetical protein
VTDKESETTILDKGRLLTDDLLFKDTKEVDPV